MGFKMVNNNVHFQPSTKTCAGEQTPIMLNSQTQELPTNQDESLLSNIEGDDPEPHALDPFIRPQHYATTTGGDAVQKRPKRARADIQGNSDALGATALESGEHQTCSR